MRGQIQQGGGSAAESAPGDTSGNGRLFALAQRRHAQTRIQRKKDDGQEGGDTEPAGQTAQTDFGELTVVADEEPASEQLGQITRSDLEARQRAWDAVKSDSGALKISEVDGRGKTKGGFREWILQKISHLLSKSTGAQLIISIVDGGQPVTICPAFRRQPGGMSASSGEGSEKDAEGNPGPGGATTIHVDSDLGDSSIKVYDEAGKEIAQPVFIALGHELIHAQRNQRDEEEEVIADTKQGARPARAQRTRPARRAGHVVVN